MSRIHSTAVIDPAAELGDVEVGPYAVVGAGVRLADGVSVGAHAVLMGPMSIGARTQVGPHVVLGGPPQDRKHDPAVVTGLIIGEDNVFREFSTAHRGTSAAAGQTVIGHRNYFMANSHVAHDCRIGSDTLFANSAAVAGHVEVGDGAVLGGLCAVHQHGRIGRLAMIGGGAMCAQDVPPFTIAQGDRARLYGLNIIGLKRAGFSSETVSAIKEAWRVLFVSQLPKQDALRRVEAAADPAPEVAELISFVRESSRGLCRAAMR